MHVFVDESDSYLVCAVLVPPAALATSRQAMRRLLCAGERRVHFNNESPARRRALLAAMDAVDLRAWIYTSAASSVVARHACLTQLVHDLADQAGPTRLIIESREGRDEADRRTVFVAASDEDHALTYEHLRPHEEPLLWAADGICWAYGAGGDWRRRVALLVQRTTQLD